ncbi:hypothetical protein HRI_002609800 [Hibiscus trionum]|uniref:RING-type domain-containing protein n=1 Tax=Hibiscus trionum TaxID=183268 RepID=A0A9W7M8I4_HIBTR|nr:hypothetical protein HRI_002609800 [Hibiscus trionum]
MSDDYINVQRRPLMEFLTCPLCQNLYREATTICICLHTFCEQCIYRKLETEERSHCPVCNAYLGSFPEKMLRNDHNLRRLVTQISGTSTEADIHSINKKQNELIDLEIPGAHNVIAEPTSRAFSLETYETEFNVQGKGTIRKPCKFLTGEREDGLKIDTTNETSKLDASGLGKSTGLTNLCIGTIDLNQHPDYSPRSVWFRLLASQETKGVALPQIPKPFIHTKNGDLDVSFVNKYLARKLNLKHESEVEVMCLGHPLVPNLTLNDLIEIWLEATSGIKPVPVKARNGDARNFLMELTYRRSNE